MADRFNVIELFGGILPLCLACQKLGTTPFQTAVCEICPYCRQCNLINHPTTVDWGGVEDVTAETVTLFGLEVPNLFLTAAPQASGKFIHVGRILSLAEKVFNNVCGVI